MKKSICAECGNKSGNWIFKKTVRRYIGEGYSFEMDVELPYCEKCGALVYVSEIEAGVREEANAIIRKQTGIITKEEIIDLVEFYGISQKTLSKVLGWGEVTLPRYISGNYTPNWNNSQKLKSIRSPYYMLHLIEEKNIDEHDNSLEKLVWNSNKRIEEISRDKGKIYQVVNWFLSNISEENGITHLALQKALYFAQAWNKTLNDKWLFNEECEAWVHGAVYRKVFDEFKGFSFSRLPMLNTSNDLTEDEISVLEFVKENYLDIYSAKTLENICHLEEPFIESRGSLKDKTRSDAIIKKDSIAKYYSQVAKRHGIDKNNLRNVRQYLNELLFG